MSSVSLSDPGTQIGGDLMLPHPNGVVIHPDVTIGSSYMIFQQVTLGSTRGAKGVPARVLPGKGNT